MSTNKLKEAITQYISVYNEMMSYVGKGEQYISVPGSYTGTGKEYAFYSASENECKKILNDSVKTNTLNSYEYHGAFKDTSSRAIPTYVQEVGSVEQAISVASEKGATLFGIQNGSQLFITTKEPAVALFEATQYGEYKENCANDLGCSWMNKVYVLKSGSFSGGTYHDSSEYNYVGAYTDTANRAIPTEVGWFTDKTPDEIQEIAKENGATVYGIQSGGQLFVNTGDKIVALSDARNYGKAECDDPKGCFAVNQVYEFAGNNCFLYDNGYGTSTYVEGGETTAFVNVEKFYGEKMEQLLENIQTLIDNADSSLQESFSRLMENLKGTNYPGYIDKLKAQKKQLEIFAQENKLIDQQYNISYDKLKQENMSFRIWVFILLFVLFIILQLFQNPILKSLSYVCLFFMLSIIVFIVKLLSPLLFMISIFLILLSVVLSLFFNKQYMISIGVLIVGSTIFALIYRL
jgi:hypothetical protein